MRPRATDATSDWLSQAALTKMEKVNTLQACYPVVREGPKLYYGSNPP